MAGHAAPGRENGLGGPHAFHIFRVGLLPHQDDLFTGLVPGYRIHGIKHDLAEGGPRSGGQALGNGTDVFFGIRVHERVEHFI